MTTDNRTSEKVITYTQYRLSWIREGMDRPKHKKYRSMKPVNRMLTLLGPEPWNAWLEEGEDPDGLMCCSGYECGCGGETVRENALARRKDLPPVLWTKITKRTVKQTQWVEA